MAYVTRGIDAIGWSRETRRRRGRQTRRQRRQRRAGARMFRRIIDTIVISLD